MKNVTHVHTAWCALRSCHLLWLCCLLCVLSVTECVCAEDVATLTPEQIERQEQPSASSQDETIAERPSEGTGRNGEDTPEAAEEDTKEGFFARLRGQVYKSVSSSARWFDSFFGDTKSYQETERSHGKIETHLFWDEKDGFDPRVRFKAKLYLPELENRWNIFLGRTNQQDFLTESSESLERVSQQARSPDDEDDWLVGLGFHPLRSERDRLDFQAGVNLVLPPEPFAKIRYRANLFVRENNLFRFRETLFWEQEDGFGSSTKIDFDHLFRKRFLLRWANNGKISETSEGFEWWTGLILYQNLTDLQALSYEGWIRGATERPVTIRDYGAQIIYRQNLEGDWLFGELRGDVSWPKDEPEDERKTVWGCGIGLELLFGENK